jgi:hypothetical protein
VAALAGAALALGACNGDCPTDTAYVDQAQATFGDCSVPAETWTFQVPLCQTCQYTSPSCAVDVLATPSQPGGAGGQLQVVTIWQVCQDNEGCTYPPGEPCSFPQCTATVPVAGTYDVSYIANDQGTIRTPTFTVQFGAGGANTCGG